MNGAEAFRIARFLFADSGKRPPASHGQEVSEPPPFPPKNVPACKPRSRAVSWKSIFC